MKKKTVTTKSLAASAAVSPETLLTELRELIGGVRTQVAQAVNAGMTMLYWQVGDRIRREILREKRAKYGEEIVSALGRQLGEEFGRGFSEKSLRHMIRFAEAFPDVEIVSPLVRQLSWTHFLAIIYLKDPLQRDFYAEMCHVEHWSKRTLQERIQSMLYERTALSKKPEQLIEKELKALREKDRMTPELVLREIESFLLELGSGFAFVERQKRITLDGDDYYIDLLFYHRRLQRLVAIELKVGDFKPADAGQMELYLRWLDRYERQEGEAKPLGLILCAGKKTEVVELLELKPRGIHVAEYLTELPPRALLEQRLREAVLRARLRLSEQPADDEPPATVPAGKKRSPK